MSKKTTKYIIQIICYFSLIASFLLIQLSSCKETENKQKIKPTNPKVLTVKKWISNQWPKSDSQYKTTNSKIYLANLNSSIEVFNRLYEQTSKAQHGAQLASKLYLRFRILGDFNDAIDSLTLINDVSTKTINDANIFITQASIQSGFHQFDSALTSIRKANELGVMKTRASQLESEINYSLGYYVPYESLINDPQIENIIKAKYALLNNNFKQASQYLKKEMDDFNDTDPFKLSWLNLQQGIAFLRYGDLASAKIFFSAAHNRFPEYYLATEHLAETEFLLGNLEVAKTLYEEVIKQTENPEFYAQLAKVEDQLGYQNTSKITLSQAQIKFDKLIQSYPEAIGDHAIQFYIDNNQVVKALDLAKLNLENRKNIESYQLLIKSALASNEPLLACNTYKQAMNINVTPIELIQLSSGLSCRNMPITSH